MYCKIYIYIYKIIEKKLKIKIKKFQLLLFEKNSPHYTKTTKGIYNMKKLPKRIKNEWN
jgi:hypothetical protein